MMTGSILTYVFCETSCVCETQIPPATTKSKLINFSIYIGHSQGHKVIDPGVIWKVFHAIYEVSISKVKKLWPKLHFFAIERQTHSQTGQKPDAPEFHSGGTRISKKLQTH